jgi:hypothetical protein
MDIQLGPLIQRTIWGPGILFTALIFPKIFYASYASRILTFVAVAASVVWALQPHDIDNPATSYLFGFAPCWTLIVAAVLLLLSTPARDFRRIRRKDEALVGKGGTEELYEWEPFPEQMSRRCWWALDLMVNWRGLGWSYQRRQHFIPDAVKKVYDEAGINVKRDGSQDEKRCGQTRSSFLVQQSWYFVVDYVLLDLCIYFMDRDPWFNRPLGSDQRLLFGYPSGNYDVLVPVYRVFVGTLATYTVMDVAHVVLALVCVGLGPRNLGTLGEPWQHPPLWGTLDDLFHRGLPGEKSPGYLPQFLTGNHRLLGQLLARPLPLPIPHHNQEAPPLLRKRQVQRSRLPGNDPRLCALRFYARSRLLRRAPRNCPSVAICWLRGAIYRRRGAGNDYHAHGGREGWAGCEAGGYDWLLVVLGVVDGADGYW